MASLQMNRGLRAVSAKPQRATSSRARLVCRAEEKSVAKVWPFRRQWRADAAVAKHQATSLLRRACQDFQEGLAACDASARPSNEMIAGLRCNPACRLTARTPLCTPTPPASPL